MDLQTRKLNIITGLAQLQDESLFEKIENLSFKNDKNTKFNPFAVNEFISRIEKSEDNFLNGKFKTQEELEKISENW